MGAGTTLDPEHDGARGIPTSVYAGEGAEAAYRSLDGNQPRQRRDFSALNRLLDGVIPTLPLTYVDAAAMFDIVREHAPSPLIREVMHDHRELVVRIFDGNVKIFERRLAAR